MTARPCDACVLMTSSYQGPSRDIKSNRDSASVEPVAKRRCAAAHRYPSRASERSTRNPKYRRKINRRRAYDNPQLCSGAGGVTPQVARRLSDQDIICDYRMTVRFNCTRLLDRGINLTCSEKSTIADDVSHGFLYMLNQILSQINFHRDYLL